MKDLLNEDKLKKAMAQSIQDQKKLSPDNTVERLLYEYRYDSRAIDEDLVLQQNPADVEKAHQSNLEETKGQIEAMFAQAVNKARLSELKDISICNHFGDYADHILFKGRPENFTIQDRIKELETPNQVEGK
jgi:hypothetical protein